MSEALPLDRPGCARRTSPGVIRPRPGWLWRIDIRSIRLASGLVLFAYVGLHLLDHSMGNVSIAAMEAMLTVMKAVWQSPFGTAALYSAMTVHLVLGFWALYERRRFQWRASEAIQLVLGFCIPVLLANHILNTRVSQALFDTDKRYMIELYSFWVGNTPFGIVQHVVLVVAWAHGCLGVYFWLRLKRWFPPAAPLLLTIAVLLPILALLGSFQGGRAIQALAHDPVWRAHYLIPAHTGTIRQNQALAEARMASWAVFAVALAAVLAARGVRNLRERRRGLIELHYPEDRTLRVPKGLSVLEASRLYRVPHASVCGERGRCTTCRVRVRALDGGDAMPAPSAVECAALARISTNPEIRLACQLRPTVDLQLTPLLPPHGLNADWRQPMHDGEERYLVMMFVDLRGSTQLAEVRLPYDTVFIVNSFLGTIGAAVSSAGGEANQMLGDGILALFGMNTDPRTAARQALGAASGIARGVEDLNRRLAADLPEPLRFGIGIQGGDVILGDIGYRDFKAFTVLGDAVNVAARLESLTKEYGVALLVADDVYGAAGGAGPDATDEWPKHSITARGRAAELIVRSANADDLMAVRYEVSN